MFLKICFIIMNCWILKNSNNNCQNLLKWEKILLVFELQKVGATDVLRKKIILYHNFLLEWNPRRKQSWKFLPSVNNTRIQVATFMYIFTSIHLWPQVPWLLCGHHGNPVLVLDHHNWSVGKVWLPEFYMEIKLTLHIFRKIQVLFFKKIVWICGGRLLKF